MASPYSEYPPFTLEDALAVRELSRRDTRLGRQVKVALDIIDEAIRRYGDHLALSFNGGKDCTVLVHLFATAICVNSQGQQPSASRQSTSANTASTSSSPLISSNSNGVISNNGRASLSHPSTNGSSSHASSSTTATTTNTTSSNTSNPSIKSCIQPAIPCIYVQCRSPFPQVEQFVDLCSERYNLDLWRICSPMKEALQQYKLEHEKHSGNEIKAILVGTRLGDPYSEHLDTFSETDNGWPKLMRVHPILEWNYNDIWEFLRCEEIGKGGIGWCELYDYGYTSLGSKFNTIPNPLLRDPSNKNGWKPAWELEDTSAERAGRPAGPIPNQVAKALDVHQHHHHPAMNGDKHVGNDVVNGKQ